MLPSEREFGKTLACFLTATCVALGAAPARSQDSAPTGRPGGILGAVDHRVPISSDAWPWSSIGRINIQKTARGASSCTGTLIGPRHVLTAAHCLFDTRQNNWVNPDQITFVAALAPGNKYQGLSVAVEFVKDPYLVHNVEDRPRYDQIRPDMIGRDWAVIILKDAINLKPIPWRSIHHADLPSAAEPGEIVRAGYSADRRFQLSGHRGCSAKTDAVQLGMLVHQCDSMPGDSGSPVLLIKGDNVSIIGIHTVSHEDFEAGVGYKAVAGLGVSASAFENQAFWLDPKYAEAFGIRDNSGSVRDDKDRDDPDVVNAAWVRLAAEKGIARAQAGLGVLYANGLGVPKDYAQALKWFRLAADHGDERAQYNLGVMYATGEGVPQDYAEAIKWHRLAADQGATRAQLDLGVMYANGLGVPQDRVTAHMWFSVAATLGMQSAAKDRDTVARAMTPAQIAEAEKLAREWKPATTASHSAVSLIIANLREAFSAFSKSDYPTALRLFRTLADEGVAEAEYGLGLIYANGRGVPQNDADALRWFRKAADQNLGDAQVNLGAMYEAGRGAPQNHGEAAKWFRLAAVQGVDRAEHGLAVMYVRGLGVPRDQAAALNWERKAAEQGYSPAQNNLGAMYANGQGVSQDFVQAHMWFSLAAAQGNKEAEKNRGIVAGRLAAAQVAEAERLARDWTPAMAALSRVPPPASRPFQEAFAAHAKGDFVTALRLLRPLAEGGNASAQFNLALMFGQGQGVPKDDAEALKWYRLAAEQGLANAQVNLGLVYDIGSGVAKDQAEAVKWYRLAAEQGLAAGQSSLGYMYANGEGVTKDYGQALKWYRLAADQGDSIARANLGSMYQYGQGAPQSNTAAYMWFSLSAAQGNQGATKSKDMLAQRMTPAEIAEGQKLVRDWTPRKPPPPL